VAETLADRLKNPGKINFDFYINMPVRSAQLSSLRLADTLHDWCTLHWLLWLLTLSQGVDKFISKHKDVVGEVIDMLDDQLDNKKLYKFALDALIASKKVNAARQQARSPVDCRGCVLPLFNMCAAFTTAAQGPSHWQGSQEAEEGGERWWGWWGWWGWGWGEEAAYSGWQDTS
jgi:uncharacterized membrane protein YgcG